MPTIPKSSKNCEEKLLSLAKNHRCGKAIIKIMTYRVFFKIIKMAKGVGKSRTSLVIKQRREYAKDVKR